MESELRKAAETLRRMPIKPKRGFECGTERGIGFSEGYGCAIERLEALAVPVPTDTVRLAPWPEPDADRIEKIAEAMSTVTAPGLPWGKKSAWDREYWIKMARAVEPHVRQILTGPQRDAAVEAALDVFEAQAYNRKDVVRFAEKIVAAVRAADAEKAGAKP
jgi:hypothetical protein